MRRFDQGQKVRAQTSQGEVLEAEDCADQVQADMRHVPALSAVVAGVGAKRNRLLKTVGMGGGPERVAQSRVVPGCGDRSRGCAGFAACFTPRSVSETAYLGRGPCHLKYCNFDVDEVTTER